MLMNCPPVFWYTVYGKLHTIRCVAHALRLSHKLNSNWVAHSLLWDPLASATTYSGTHSLNLTYGTASARVPRCYCSVAVDCENKFAPTISTGRERRRYGGQRCSARGRTPRRQCSSVRTAMVRTYGLPASMRSYPKTINSTRWDLVLQFILDNIDRLG
jgi:hypothetical protein